MLLARVRIVTTPMKTIARLLTSVTLLVACGSPEPEERGDSSESGGQSAGAGAVSGSSGSAGSGDAGNATAGTGGGGGSSADAGNAGTPAVAGAPFAPMGNECTTSDDCRLVSDCCRCVSAPKGLVLDVCYAACAETMCITEGISGSDDVCVNGRCVLDRSCDRNQIDCDMPPPACEPGMIPTVDDSCFGSCMASTECRD